MNDVFLNLEEEDTRKHILIVDDDPVMLRTMKVMLEGSYSVAIITSGMQVMKAIGKKRPDLILLDYQMPVYDGKQTFQMLRSEDIAKDIPIIFLTGTEDSEQIEEILNLEPDGYFLKPPVREKLLQEIQKVLNA